jgi:hypothetical protein
MCDTKDVSTVNDRLIYRGLRPTSRSYILQIAYGGRVL